MARRGDRQDGPGASGNGVEVVKGLPRFDPDDWPDMSVSLASRQWARSVLPEGAAPGPLAWKAFQAWERKQHTGTEWVFPSLGEARRWRRQNGKPDPQRPVVRELREYDLHEPVIDPAYVESLSPAQQEIARRMLGDDAS